MESKKGFHYGFIIVISLFIQLFAAGSLLMTAGMFLVPVTTALKLTQGVYMMYMTIQYGVMAVASVFMPRLLSRYKFTSLNKVFIIIMALGAFAMAAATNIVLIYVGGALIGMSMPVVSYQCSAILIPRWFKEKQGVMLATATLGITIAGAVMSPVISSWLSNETFLGMESWRGAYVFLGAALMIVGLLNAFILLREAPADGVRYGETSSPSEGGSASAISVGGVDKSVAVRSVSFVFLILLIICFNFACPVQSYLPAYAQLSEAASIANFDVVGLLSSVVLVASAIGGYIIGFANDKFGARGGASVAGVCGVLGFIVLILFGSSPVMMLVGGALFGIYYPISNLIMPSMVTTMYGERQYAQIFPVVAAWGPWFGAVAASLWGFIYDGTGSYDAVFIIAGILCALTAVFSFAGIAASRKLKSQWQSNSSINV